MKKKSSYAHLVSDERWTWEEAYKKWFWIRFTLLLVALVLTFIVAYLYFVRLPQYEHLAEIESMQSVQGTTNHIARVADTSSWATYANADEGFAFKYPDPAHPGVTSDALPVTTSKHVTEIDIPSLGSKLVFANSADDVTQYKDVATFLDETDAAAAAPAINVSGKSVPENRAGANAYVLFKHHGIYYAYLYNLSDQTTAVKARTLLSTLSFTTE